MSTVLEHGIQQLKLGKKLPSPSKKLVKLLEDSEFDIFRPLADLGFYGWVPKRPSHYQSLVNVSADEIRNQIVLNMMPPTLKVDTVSLPHKVSSTDKGKHVFVNKYPNGQLDVVRLHVAAKYCGVDFDDINFVFGGSTLDMLVTRDSANYFATRVPGTSKAILVSKRKEYEADLSDAGFQFERLVTGTSEVTFGSVEHMQVMRVGEYTVLFGAEADAVHPQAPSEPIEIKASNPRYWGTTVMLQMISSGSIQLCQGVKNSGKISQIKCRDAANVYSDSLRGRDPKSIERLITGGMKVLREKVDKGLVYKITFDNKSLMNVTPASSRLSVILPSDEVVKELMTC